MEEITVIYELPPRLSNAITMKKLTLTTFVFFILSAVFGQNGLNNGHLFLLQKDEKTIAINSFKNEKVNEIKSFPISEKSIYTTDQKERVAILDTAKNDVTIFDVHSEKQTKISIPFEIRPKAVLLNNDNLFVGGEMGKEMLIQYHLQSEKWHQLEIPKQVLFWGKAVDDLVVNDSLLIAIDNIVMPKYVLYYHLNPKNKIELSHFRELKSNGTYEHIHQGRITQKYFGLKSGTYSGYIGGTNHITIYDNIDLKKSFSISSNEHKKDYHTFNDFLIFNDKVIIASKEKGLGTFEIKKSYFKDSDEYGNNKFNVKISASKINYTSFKNGTIIKLVIIPYTEKIILTIKDKKGVIKHEIIEG